MKSTRLIFFTSLLCFQANLLFSQEENKSIIKPFGFGLHIEQFKLNDLSDLTIAPANKIVITYHPAKSFRLEPEVGYRGGKNKNSGLKYSAKYFGLGVFGMSQQKKLNMHFGFRVEYGYFKNDGTYSDNNYNTTTTYKTTRWMIGPTAGAEYYFAENFTIGGEVGVKYATLKTTQDFKPSYYIDQKSNYVATETGLFMRFYFGK